MNHPEKGTLWTRRVSTPAQGSCWSPASPSLLARRRLRCASSCPEGALFCAPGHAAPCLCRWTRFAACRASSRDRDPCACLKRREEQRKTWSLVKTPVGQLSKSPGTCPEPAPLHGAISAHRILSILSAQQKSGRARGRTVASCNSRSMKTKSCAHARCFSRPNQFKAVLKLVLKRESGFYHCGLWTWSVLSLVSFKLLFCSFLLQKNPKFFQLNFFLQKQQLLVI